MNKFVKTLLITILAMVCAVCCFACQPSTGDEGKTGLLYKKYKNDNFYTVYGYVDDGTGVTELDISSYNVDGVSIGRIKKGAFSGNNTLTSIIVPDTVTTIDGGAFENMKKLGSITLPFVGKTANADASFNQSESAEDKAVDVERTFGYIFGTSEYAGGTEIKQVYNGKADNTVTYYLPASLKVVNIKPKADDYKIPMYAFAGNGLVQKVVLNQKTVEIGAHAFDGCSALNTIEIPASVTKIGEYAFNGCVNLKDAVNDKGLTFAAQSKVATLGDYAFSGIGVNNFVLPASVTKIGDGAFANSKLVSVDLGNLDEIAYAAFKDCKNLTTVKSSATKIGDYAFVGCTALVTYGNTANAIDLQGVTQLGVWSFANDELDDGDIINCTLSQDIIDAALAIV